ncbi:MAG: DUF1573 domain-containing protein [Bacteroidetes bacterium]|nr:DUF1573 domain-containing protein [Bacteroidota bacterium]
MKKVLLTLGVTFFLAFSLIAQNTETQPVVNKNAPVINFDKTTHDYGTVVKGGDGTCEFKFKNTGVEPLILSNVTSSCGCTVPEWPREPVLKGKSNVIKVKYDTNRVGPINKTITVVSNATNSSIQLHIIGTITDKVDGATMPVKNDGAAPIAK